MRTPLSPMRLCRGTNSNGMLTRILLTSLRHHGRRSTADTSTGCATSRSLACLWHAVQVVRYAFCRHCLVQEPGKPLFFSVLVYLNASWPRNLDAETLFLDTSSDTGIVVRPRPGRVVLMDQDILHRLSAPSLAAKTPRYSERDRLHLLPALIGFPAILQASCSSW